MTADQAKRLFELLNRVLRADVNNMRVSLKANKACKKSFAQIVAGGYDHHRYDELVDSILSLNLHIDSIAPAASEINNRMQNYIHEIRYNHLLAAKEDEENPMPTPKVPVPTLIAMYVHHDKFDAFVSATTALKNYVSSLVEQGEKS